MTRLDGIYRILLSCLNWSRQRLSSGGMVSLRFWSPDFSRDSFFTDLCDDDLLVRRMEENYLGGKEEPLLE